MSKFENMIILAGGDSTRFWPLSQKNEFSFLGKPLILQQVERLKSFSDNLFVVAHEESLERLKVILSLHPSVKIVCQDPTKMGQAGALLSVKDLLQGEVLVINANDLFNPNILKVFLEKMSTTGGGAKKDLIFLAKKVTSYFPGGYVEFDDNKKIKGIWEKPPVDQVPSDLVKLVVDYIGNFRGFTDILQTIQTDKDDWYEKGLSVLIKTTQAVEVVEYKDYWETVKYPWNILSMMKFFLSEIKDNQIDSTSLISPRAVIVPPVIIGKHVRVGDFAKIVGPCFIGENSTIGDFTLVRDSHIGKNTLIGGYSEVTRSYLADNVMLHRNYVGDSVFDKRVLMGAGAVTANFRFDEKNIGDSGRNKLGAMVGMGAKIGVNSTLLPGVKVGRNTFVGPQSLVTSDLEDNIFLHNGKKGKNLIT